MYQILDSLDGEYLLYSKIILDAHVRRRTITCVCMLYTFVSRRIERLIGHCSYLSRLVRDRPLDHLLIHAPQAPLQPCTSR